MDSFTGIFQGFWQLSRNTYLKEHLWTAASKETDVIKSSVKVYESLCKRCGITPHFLHQDTNIYQKTICSKVQCIWSGRFELRSLHNLRKSNLFGRPAHLKSYYIPWQGKICFIGNWFGITDVWLELHSVTFHFKNSDI